ncbi:MAG: hypothetical protein GC191_20170 [Azospirillum sp.]|nr:hypothetical protein [Azospirillum sp.]
MVSVIEHVHRILPMGTRPKTVKLVGTHTFRIADEAGPNWGAIPHCPTDCFAVSATLLNQAGAYHYIRMEPPAADDGISSQYRKYRENLHLTAD